MGLTCRQLFRVVGGAVVLAKLPACGDNADPVFSQTERTMLRGFADVVIPKTTRRAAASSARSPTSSG